MTLLSSEAVVNAIAGLDLGKLDRWVAFGWVLPIDAPPQEKFDAADVARIRLIWDLHCELDIDEDSVPVILSLLDQLYATRRTLRDVLAAVELQSPTVRDAIRAQIATSN